MKKFDWKFYLAAAIVVLTVIAGLIYVAMQVGFIQVGVLMSASIAFLCALHYLVEKSS